MTREEAERRVLNAVARRLEFWKKANPGKTTVPISNDPSTNSANNLIMSALELDRLEQEDKCPE